MNDNDPLQRPDSESRNHNISESADKIRLKTKITRGTDVRDQEVVEATIKGDDPAETVDRLNAVVERLAETAETVRAIQPGGEDE